MSRRWTPPLVTGFVATEPIHARGNIHVVAEPDESNGLHQTTAFQVERVRAVSTGRLLERVGRLDGETRRTVDEIFRNVLKLH